MTTAGKWLGLLMLLAVGLAAGPVQSEPLPKGDHELAAWIRTRVQSWQPTKAERRFDEIGWAADIREALRLAKEHGRPVFLFTYSGSEARADAIALQRC